PKIQDFLPSKSGSLQWLSLLRPITLKKSMRGEADMDNQDDSGNRQEEKSRCNKIPEVFYPAAEAEKLLEMIRPIQEEAYRLVQETPGKYAIFEWFMRSFQLCYQETGSPRPPI